LGLCMSSFMSEQEWQIKKYPYLKPIDFLEFGDVLAQWVTSITQAFLSDSVNYVVGTPPATFVPNMTCPLTLQEMLLLLRNVLMEAFKDTQSGVQAIYPYVPASGTDNQFVPYVASTATCFTSAVDMILPIPLIENIRALVTRKVNNTAAGAQFWIPVLGQFAQTLLSSEDYLITFPFETPVTQSVFKTGVLFRVPKKDTLSTKPRSGSTGPPPTTSNYELLAETSISLVDGNSSMGIVSINDPAVLKTLATMWNDWLTGSGISTYSCGTGTFGTEKGISVLESLSTTRHVSVVTENERSLRRERMVDLRLETPHYRRVQNQPYSQFQAIANSSYATILSVPYEQVLSTWILPVNLVEFSATPTNSTTVVRWQNINDETHLQSLTSGTTGMSMAQMHATYATKMTKGRTAESNDWSKTFTEMAATGRGGILSSLVSGLVSSFSPSLGSAVSSIGSAIGI